MCLLASCSEVHHHTIGPEFIVSDRWDVHIQTDFPPADFVAWAAKAGYPGLSVQPENTADLGDADWPPTADSLEMLIANPEIQAPKGFDLKVQSIAIRPIDADGPQEQSGGGVRLAVSLTGTADASVPPGRHEVRVRFPALERFCLKHRVACITGENGPTSLTGDLGRLKLQMHGWALGMMWSRYRWYLLGGLLIGMIAGSLRRLRRAGQSGEPTDQEES